MHPKDADGMANSVDPDQTASSEAVWSWSALFAETYLSQYIEFVRYMVFCLKALKLYIGSMDAMSVSCAQAIKLSCLVILVHWMIEQIFTPLSV